MKEILGKWAQPEGQAYPGLWFEFKDDGTFKSHYDAMGIDSSGTYVIKDTHINMDQTAHTFGLIGKFEGIFEIDGNTLKMTLVSAADKPRPTDLSEARIYIKTN